MLELLRALPDDAGVDVCLANARLDRTKLRAMRRTGLLRWALWVVAGILAWSYVAALLIH